MIFKAQPLYLWGETVEADTEDEWLVKDLILRDSAVQVSGPATRGFKTWWAFANAMCVASGKPFGPLVPGLKPQRVLICEKEGPRRATWNRFKFLQNGSGINIKEDCGDRIMFSHRELLYLERKDHVAEVCKYVKDNDIGLVIIDTLAKSFQGDENSVQDITRALEGLDQIRNARPGCVVMWLHHVGKPSESSRDIDHETRGSSALAGYYDIHQAMRRKDGDKQHVYLTLRSNEFEERYYQITWLIDKDKQIATLAMEPLLDPDALSNQDKDRAIGALLPDESYNKEGLMRAWGTGRQKMNALLEQLVEEGVLVKTGRMWRLK